MPGVFDVRLYHSVFGEIITRTRDMSNGGFFVELDGVALPQEGSIIQMQLLYSSNGIDAKPRDMLVVRVTEKGIALQFAE